MPCQVDIYDDVLAAIESWGLPEAVRHSLLRKMLDDLENKLSDKIGEYHCVAPVRLRRYCLSIPDCGNAYIHHFVFLVNDMRGRRVVMLGEHRTTDGC